MERSSQARWGFTPTSHRKHPFTVLALLLAAVLLAPWNCLAAEEYPSHPVQFVISFPPGGPGDTTIRIIHNKLQENFGGTIQLVNKPGAGGAIAYNLVKKSKPDGYTVLSTMSAPLTVGTALEKLEFGLDDYEYIGAYAFGATGIVSKPDSRWKDLDGLLAYMKNNPGKLNYGTSGAATAPYLTMEAICSIGGLKAVPVHYNGSAPARDGALGGHVDFSVCSFSICQELIRAGRLIGMAITDPVRDPEFPQIPTLDEKGLGDASIHLWAGLWTPKGTPKPVLDKLAASLEKTMQDKQVAENLKKAGYRAQWMDGAGAKKVAKKDYETALKVIDSLGLKKK